MEAYICFQYLSYVDSLFPLFWVCLDRGIYLIVQSTKQNFINGEYYWGVQTILNGLKSSWEETLHHLNYALDEKQGYFTRLKPSQRMDFHKKKYFEKISNYGNYDNCQTILTMKKMSMKGPLN